MRGSTRFRWWAWFAVIALPSLVTGLYYMGGNAGAVLDIFFGLHYMLWPFLAPAAFSTRDRSSERSGPNESGFLWISTVSAGSAAVAPYLGAPIPGEAAAIGLLGLGLVAAAEVSRRLVLHRRPDSKSGSSIQIFGSSRLAWLVFLSATSAALALVVPPARAVLGNDWILLVLGLYPGYHLLMGWVAADAE